MPEASRNQAGAYIGMSRQDIARRAYYAAEWHARPEDPLLHIATIGVRMAMPAGAMTYRGRHQAWQIMEFHQPVEFAVAGMPVQRLPTGTAVIWSPDRRPAWYGNRLQPWSHSWIVVCGRLWDELLASCPLPRLAPLPLPGPAAMGLCIRGLHAELTAQEHPDPQILCCHLGALVRSLHRACSRDALPGHADQRMLWARSHLERHLDRRVDLRRLARDQKMSLRQFTRRFAAAWGMTPAAYHAQVRMAHAALLLGRAEFTIAQIARMVGYANGFSFSKAYSRWSGSSPTSCRLPS